MKTEKNIAGSEIERTQECLAIEGGKRGLSNTLMTNWGHHLYHNIPSLLNKGGVDGAGFPWKLAENAGLERQYDKGTCPAADSLFERSIILAVPSCLTERDENDDS